MSFCIINEIYINRYKIKGLKIERPVGPRFGFVGTYNESVVPLGVHLNRPNISSLSMR